MALKLALFVAMAIVPVIVGATEFNVGDDAGWILGINYTEWAKDKVFKVGDKLVFKYGEGKHDVLKVGGSGFKACNKTSEEKPLTSGKDVISLVTAGRKWYICTIGNHCDKGMKLFITVEEAEAPAPSPSGGHENSANIIASFASSYLVGLAAMLAMAIMF